MESKNLNFDDSIVDTKINGIQYVSDCNDCDGDCEADCMDDCDGND